jgi:hypothetical protein
VNNGVEDRHTIALICIAIQTERRSEEGYFNDRN